VPRLPRTISGKVDVKRSAELVADPDVTTGSSETTDFGLSGTDSKKQGSQV